MTSSNKPPFERGIFEASLDAQRENLLFVKDDLARQSSAATTPRRTLGWIFVRMIEETARTTVMPTSCASSSTA